MSSPLLKLPLEIRSMVYHYTLEPGPINEPSVDRRVNLHCDHAESQLTGTTMPGVNLLYCNKQLYKEAQPVLYTSNTFYLGNNYGTMMAFLLTIGSFMAALIRHIVVLQHLIGFDWNECFYGEVGYTSQTSMEARGYRTVIAEWFTGLRTLEIRGMAARIILTCQVCRIMHFPAQYMMTLFATAFDAIQKEVIEPLSQLDKPQLVMEGTRTDLRRKTWRLLLHHLLGRLGWDINREWGPRRLVFDGCSDRLGCGCPRRNSEAIRDAEDLFEDMSDREGNVSDSEDED